MSIARWTSCVALAAAMCVTSAALAQRGPGMSTSMRAGGWNGGHWHDGGWHHGGHGHGFYGASVGIYLGPAAYWGWPYDYDPWPYYDAYGNPYAYAYPAPHVTYAYPTDSSYYVEPAPDMAPEPPSFRYYCSDPPGYYPQVTHCTQPWLRVLPDDARAPGDASGAPGTPTNGK